MTNIYLKRKQMAKRIRKKFDGLFMNIINWRLVNMIIDKLLKYEDMDMTCAVNVFISKDGDFNMHSQVLVYTCMMGLNNGSGLWRDQGKMTDEEALELLRKYGMFISIMIYDSNNLYHKYNDEMAELQANLEATGKLSHLSKNWIGADVYWVNR